MLHINNWELHRFKMVYKTKNLGGLKNHFATLARLSGEPPKISIFFLHGVDYTLHMMPVAYEIPITEVNYTSWRFTFDVVRSMMFIVVNDKIKIYKLEREKCFGYFARAYC